MAMIKRTTFVPTGWVKSYEKFNCYKYYESHVIWIGKQN